LLLIYIIKRQTIKTTTRKNIHIWKHKVCKTWKDDTTGLTISIDCQQLICQVQAYKNIIRRTNNVCRWVSQLYKNFPIIRRRWSNMFSQASIAYQVQVIFSQIIVEKHALFSRDFISLNSWLFSWIWINIYNSWISIEMYSTSSHLMQLLWFYIEQ
jgi:hypothetical protein